MPVLRTEKDKNFTVMSNIHLRDKNLSLKAKGLLSLMLSLPPDWKYSLNGLCAISKESRKAICSTLKELQDYHYLKLEKVRDEKGYFQYNYLIYEKPFSNEVVKPSSNKKGDKEHHPLTNKLIEIGYIVKKEKDISQYDKMFEQLLKNKYSDIEIRNSIIYVVPEIIKRDFKDEEENPISNKLNYLKNSLLNNMKRCKYSIDLWEEEDIFID